MVNVLFTSEFVVNFRLKNLNLDILDESAKIIGPGQ